MNKEVFNKISKKHQTNTNLIKDCLLAFLGGGITGLISQGLIDLYHLVFHIDLDLAFALSSASIVLIASILTMISYYNDLGQIFGAGLFIPITGFSNSMVSASIEGRSEGPIYGVGSRIFSLSGSVIAFGVSFSIILGFIYSILVLIGVKL